jgi:uncharacterized protein (DUF1800 family)
MVRKFPFIVVALFVFFTKFSVADDSLDWRLYSRFGYAPAQINQGSNSDIKSVALNRLNEAQLASKQEPFIPEQISIVKTTLPDAFERWRDQRKLQQSLQENAPREFTKEMSRATMALRVFQCSHDQIENPLLAKMTEFWFNHLNVYTYKGSVQPFIADYILNVIRPNVFGNFEDLLIASFKHPAMLYYLDQWLNAYVENPRQSNRFNVQVKGINENYAREVLELHTMGVNSGYTQSDVQSLARILTGWTISAKSESGSQFVNRLHDKSDQTLLGRTFSNQGEEQAISALKFLANQPQTARRISLRLAQWFVSDHPSDRLVESMANTYMQTHGNIYQVMKTLIESDDAWDKSNQLIKTPLDYVCSVLTVAGGAKDLKDYTNALNFLSNSGQPMNAWQTPDGYSTLADQWMSAEALSRRADFAFLIGSKVEDPERVLSWVSKNSRTIISNEKPNVQSSFALASPDFMRK